MLSPRTYCTPGTPRRAVTMGYVTWSSTMSGLRPIHSVEMITWVSDRSGIASSGVSQRARTPNPAATMIAARVSTRFRAHHAMRRSIIASLPFLRRRLELALRRYEEIARGHHDLSGLEPAQHFVVVPGLGAQGDGARREPSVPEIHEHDALVADVEDGALRYRQTLSNGGAEHHVDEHVRLQVAARIGNDDAHLGGSRFGVEIGIDVRDLALARVFGQERRKDRRRHAASHEGQLVGIHARDDPDRVDGRDLVESLARGEGASPDNILFEHD